MLKAFIYGVLEFRSNITLNFGDNMEAYDIGRDLAHRLTLRVFDRD